MYNIVSRVSSNLFPFILLITILYFGFFSIWGNRGLLKLMELRNDLQQTNTALSESQSLQRKLSYKVELLRHSIDLDMLDERARKVLNYVAPEEIVIFTSEINTNLITKN